MLGRQWTDTNPRRFYYDEIAVKLVGMRENHGCDTIRLGCVREAIQLQQDHAPNAKPLTNDQLTEVPVLGNQDATGRIGYFEHLRV